jgi:hypothetical protein
MNQARPAQVVLDAPASLAGLFAPSGYHVQLLVTRTGVTSLKGDTGADAMPIDAPFGPEERKALDGMVAGYEADRK